MDALARDPKTNLSSANYISGATTNNFQANLPFSKDTISYDIKSDYTLGPKDHLSGRFSHQNINTFQAPAFACSWAARLAVDSKQQVLPAAKPTVQASTTITFSRQECSLKRAPAWLTFVTRHNRLTTARTMRRLLESRAMAPTERTRSRRPAGQVAFLGKYFLGSAHWIFGVIAMVACRVEY